MQIISHRGYWLTAAEKNSEAAFRRSFRAGIGTETDIRDRDGHLVISHDPASQDSLPLETFLTIYKEEGDGLLLALNIKADGLQGLLKSALEAFDVSNYFVFDMSVPDTLGYLNAGMPFFTRQSEYEPHPALYSQAVGVWMDCFREEWLDEDAILRHLDADKIVCLVSPELHKRPYGAFWEELHSWRRVMDRRDLILCTDYPHEAQGRLSR